jgi:hypothetical protein
MEARLLLLHGEGVRAEVVVKDVGEGGLPLHPEYHMKIMPSLPCNITLNITWSIL